MSFVISQYNKITSLKRAASRSRKTSLAQEGFDLVRGFLPRRERLGAVGKEKQVRWPQMCCLEVVWNRKPTGFPGLDLWVLPGTSPCSLVSQCLPVLFFLQ